jgi:hypothetical protein
MAYSYEADFIQGFRANDQKDLSTSTHAIAWKPSCVQMDDNHQDDIDNTKPKPKYHGNICFYKNS